ncbi:MAG: hypothetical protein FJ146_03330 [Deltaproteobacteria bacterium]|nr:hypothetical protein [Deltaproteobacteria bacterium]
MKRRSSDEQWLFRALGISFFALFVIITASLRVVTLSARYGIIPLEIPVVQSYVPDPRFHKFDAFNRDNITNNTAALILTSEAFYFGDLSSFSVDFTSSQNKYSLPHKDGLPQIQKLVKEMSLWVSRRSKNSNIPLSPVLVMIPSGDIPMPILIEVVAVLRSSSLFGRVILSSGMS